jgi:hypothetical protein
MLPTVIFKLVSSEFHLLFRYLQNIYIFSAAREMYIKTAVCILGVWKNRKSILQVKVLPVAWFAHASGYIWPSIQWRARTSKTPIFWKIQNKYFYSPYSNETSYTKALNTRSILLTLTPAMCWGLDWRPTNEQRLMRPRPSDGWIKIGAGVITDQIWNISVMFS